MEIKISDNKKIITDSNQYIFCLKAGKSWRQKWFYPDLKTCYNSLLEELTMKGDKETLKENVEQALKLLEGAKARIK